MSVVSIHQPNYLPWLGYFHKMASSDILVLLDDVQFSKQSYINRVKILGGQGDRWLSVPVKASLGDTINAVTPANSGWVRSHIDTLYGAYKSAAKFKQTWPAVETLYDDLPTGSIADINTLLIRRIAGRLGIETELLSSSTLNASHLRSDDRLVCIVKKLSPQGTYLSGKGGTGYQDPAKFKKQGIEIALSNFQHPKYDQGLNDFVAGLSILDAVFHLGWERTAEVIG